VFDKRLWEDEELSLDMVKLCLDASTSSLKDSRKLKTPKPPPSLKIRPEINAIKSVYRDNKGQPTLPCNQDRMCNQKIQRRLLGRLQNNKGEVNQA